MLCWNPHTVNAKSRRDDLREVLENLSRSVLICSNPLPVQRLIKQHVDQGVTSWHVLEVELRLWHDNQREIRR